MQDGCENSLNRIRFQTSGISLQVGTQRYGRGDGRKRKKKNKEGHGDRLRTDRQRQTHADEKEMNIPGPKKPGATDIVTSTEGRDCKTKGNLSHFLICEVTHGSTMCWEMMSACDHCLLRKLADMR